MKNIRMNNLAIAALGLFLLSFSCRDIQKTEAIIHQENLIIKSLTSQSFVPGMESNLRKTMRYECEMSGDFNLQISLTNLIVDSVKVPMASIYVDGQNQNRYPIIRQGRRDSIKIMANRLIFNRNSQNQMIPEVILEGHDYEVPEGEALMEYSIGEEIFTMPLGPISIKETVYNP